MSKRSVAMAINALVRTRARLKRIEETAARYRRTILAAGGGESSLFIANLVVMPAHTTRFPEVVQVRVRRRPAKK